MHTTLRHMKAGEAVKEPIEGMVLVCGFCRAVLKVGKYGRVSYHERATGRDEAPCGYGGDYTLFQDFHPPQYLSL